MMKAPNTDNHSNCQIFNAGGSSCGLKSTRATRPRNQSGNTATRRNAAIELQYQDEFGGVCQ